VANVPLMPESSGEMDIKCSSLHAVCVGGTGCHPVLQTPGDFTHQI
jgi:hypothetical protein